MVMRPKYADERSNSKDPNQAVPRAAVKSGAALFAQIWVCTVCPNLSALFAKIWLTKTLRQL